MVHTLKVAEANDWDLVCVISWYGCANSLPLNIQGECNGAIQSKGTFYPKSCIEVKEVPLMAKAVRDILGREGITEFQAWSLPGYAWHPKQTRSLSALGDVPC